MYLTPEKYDIGYIGERSLITLHVVMFYNDKHKSRQSILTNP